MAGREHIFQQAMNQGHSAAWDQDWEHAAQFYRKALEEFPDNPRALTSLGLALFELRRFDEALRCYLQAAKVAPDDPAPLTKIGEIYERLGRVKEAAQAFARAGDLYLRLRDVDKAIESWTTALALVPTLLQTRLRLAQVYEKLGKSEQAAHEHIAAAAVLQHAGRKPQALEVLQRALQAHPNSPQLRQALSTLQKNRPLPLPPRKRGATAPLRMARVRQQAEKEKPTAGHTPDPIDEARQQALSALAELLFEQQAESQTGQRADLDALTKGTGQLDQSRIRRTQIQLHIGHAIDLITRQDYALAIPEISQAISAGLEHPAAYFLLGYLQWRAERLESAGRNLHQAVKHQQFGIAARLIRSKIALTRERWREAAVEALEALKLADVAVTPAEQAEEVRQLYEPLIEEQQRREADEEHQKLANGVLELILRPNWRKHLGDIRKQVTAATEQAVVPIATMLTEARSSQVVDHMSTIMKLAKVGHLRSAMEEAFYALQFAPTYLPLHVTMGELLLKQERLEEALAKFKTVARSYSVRGEAVQSVRLLRRVVQLAPMDMDAHRELIRLLSDQGAVDEALSEYINLAEAYYRLAELDAARQTYEQALRLAEQSHADRAWKVQILHHMADIDIQRLNWRKALRVYEQIVSLTPNDEIAQSRLVELNYRLGNPSIAVQMLDRRIRQLQNQGETGRCVEFLEQLIETLPEEPELLQRLGQVYQMAGEREKAVATLDKAGELLLQQGRREDAIQVIQQIIRLNPPQVEQYRQLLDRI